jgi:glycosyltransferase involved in cell wall biosynthesis
MTERTIGEVAQGREGSCSFPRVSVIIPVFNRAGVIIEAIRSVQAQTYQAFEIIVIDDCSPDDPVKALERMALRNLVVVRLAKNSGGGVARNVGVSKATGELVAFLDSDDLWAPNKLQVQVEKWIELGKPDNFFSYTAVRITKNNCPTIENPEFGFSYEEPLSKYLFCDKNSIQTSSYVMSRGLAADNPFPLVRKHQDWDLIFRLYEKKVPFFFISEALTEWRQGDTPNRVSANPNYRMSLQWHERVAAQIDKKNSCRLCFYGCVVFPTVFSLKNSRSILKFMLFFLMRERVVGLKYFVKYCIRFYLRKIINQ